MRVKDFYGLSPEEKRKETIRHAITEIIEYAEMQADYADKQAWTLANGDESRYFIDLSAGYQKAIRALKEL